MGKVSQEIELKFSVPAETAEAVWRAVAPESDRGKTLVSTYFDTEDRRLAKAGLALRIRDDGRGSIQTLKGEGVGAFARAEYEQPVAGPGIDLSALADTPAAAALDGAEPAPLFSVKVRRRKADLIQGASVIEACLDTGWVEGGGQRETISEIELELKSGSPRALFPLARRLMQKKRPLVLAFESKAERGFRLVDGEGARPSRVHLGMDAAAAFTAIGEAALAQISGAGAALESEITPRGVHELRVGLRRLRSAITSFKSLLGDPETAMVSAELKWLAGALDEMRDLDVLAESVASVDGAFHAVLEAARADARGRLSILMAAPRRRALPLRIAEWLAVGRWRMSRLRPQRLLREQAIVAFASDALDKRFGKLDRKTDLESLAPEARHEERIKIKKLRYAAEAFGPAFGEHPKRQRRQIAGLKAAQEALGALNDEAVGRDLAHRLVVAGGDPEAAFAAGAAFAPDPRQTARRLKAAQDTWDEIFEERPFWR